MLDGTPLGWVEMSEKVGISHCGVRRCWGIFGVLRRSNHPESAARLIRPSEEGIYPSTSEDAKKRDGVKNPLRGGVPVGRGG